MSYPDPSSQTPEQRLEAARDWAERGGGTVEAALPGQSAQVSERLQTVIAAAERAADAIRSDAEEQARRHLAEAQRQADEMTAERVRVIAHLTDDLIGHAAIIKEHSEQLVGALERAIGTVAGRLEEAGIGSHPPQAIDSRTATQWEPGSIAANQSTRARAGGPSAAPPDPPYPGVPEKGA